MSDGNYAHGDYTGDGKALFFLALRTGLLTFFTLGIYRFWAKTRIRRFIWSSTRLDGSRFEYTGTGLEKFLGFLMAVVILAVSFGFYGLALDNSFWHPEDFEVLEGKGLKPTRNVVTNPTTDEDGQGNYIENDTSRGWATTAPPETSPWSASTATPTPTR